MFNPIDSGVLEVPTIGRCTILVYPTYRQHGRRIKVFSQDRAGLPNMADKRFDTEDCYDLGNAISTLCNWIEQKKS